MGILFMAALVALLPVAAQAMDVATFLTRAEAAQRKGPAAIFSGEARSLMGEVQAAGKALKAERLADEAAGRRPAYCPTGKGGLSQSELLAALRAVPPERRAQTEVKDALRAAYARKHPCVR